MRVRPEILCQVIFNETKNKTRVHSQTWSGAQVATSLRKESRLSSASLSAGVESARIPALASPKHRLQSGTGASGTHPAVDRSGETPGRPARPAGRLAARCFASSRAPATGSRPLAPPWARWSRRRAPGRQARRGWWPGSAGRRARLPHRPGRRCRAARAADSGQRAGLARSDPASSPPRRPSRR